MMQSMVVPGNARDKPGGAAVNSAIVAVGIRIAPVNAAPAAAAARAAIAADTRVYLRVRRTLRGKFSQVK